MADEDASTQNPEAGAAASLRVGGSSQAKPGNIPASAPDPTVPGFAGATIPTIPGLHAHHVHQLCAESGIDAAVVAERGYRTVTTKAELRRLGFSKGQQETPDPKMTYRQCERLYAISRTALWRLISSGEVDAAKVGSAVKSSRRSVEDCYRRRGYGARR